MPVPELTDPLSPPTQRAEIVPVVLDLEAPATCQVDPGQIDLAEAARAYQEFRRGGERNPNPPASRPSDQPSPSQLFAELHRRNPATAETLAQAAVQMPQAGDEFADFRLLAELGRGAFGRVFLATQRSLADRRVVLKISADIKTEARALAKLLHTNIVPAYSVHHEGPFQAVCMPYCGSTTLADALRRFRGETLPESGKGLVTLLNSVSVTSRTQFDEPSVSELPAPTEHHPGSTVVLDHLKGLSYVDAVLWLGARLADGLAHAHDRGLLHRDLKPANILLNDDGQPMLLDFNLAADTNLDGVVEVAKLGGTLPYMAPEQMDLFMDRPARLDGRTDLFALGVILYELLTGRHPYPTYSKVSKNRVERMQEDRRKPPPPLRPYNPAVSPAVESIVRKCLQGDPNQRYPSARALMEDLERQIEHQPLKYAPEPSLKERIQKWARRHPRLSSSAFLGSCAAVVLIAVVTLTAYQVNRRQAAEAQGVLRGFDQQSRHFLLSLTGLPGDDRRPLAEALAGGRDVLAPFPAPDDPDWLDASVVRHLEPEQRQRLREESGVLLLMLAHARQRTASNDHELTEALKLNEQAIACFPQGKAPPPLWSQRAELLDKLGHGGEAQEMRERADVPPHTARDHYLVAWDHARHGRYAVAIPLLEQALRLDPTAVWAWFLLGRCHDQLGHDTAAVSCYSTCLALAPESHQAWFNRGLAYLRSGQFEQAAHDFTRVTELRPLFADAYFNRGLARQARGDHHGAVEDFTTALKRGAEYTRVYFVRAESRAQLGDASGAKHDREQGLKIDPVDESCWTARGYARLPNDPNGALADFNKALERNPQYLPALMNKSHVLAEIQGKTAEAVAVLDHAVKHHPQHAPLRASRGVLLARLGKRLEAHHDAEEALQLSGDPPIRYQIAGIYALTSKTHPDDRPEAYRLLAGALKKDYGHDLVPIDPELAPVRDHPEFKRLLETTRALKEPALK